MSWIFSHSGLLMSGREYALSAAVEASCPAAGAVSETATASRHTAVGMRFAAVSVALGV